MGWTRWETTGRHGRFSGRSRRDNNPMRKCLWDKGLCDSGLVLSQWAGRHHLWGGGKLERRPVEQFPGWGDARFLNVGVSFLLASHASQGARRFLTILHPPL